MRLWHQLFIPKLPRQQLLGQHRELCALRGRGWGRKHSVVNYVFEHEPERLVAYHFLIMDEMERRGYNPDQAWRMGNWRDNAIGMHFGWCTTDTCAEFLARTLRNEMIYPEHNDEYLKECIDNLKGKGIEI